MPTVYCVNKSTHDFSDAERFGELHFLSEGALKKTEVTQMARMFSEHLKDSTIEDYILITGMSVMSSIACSIFVSLHKRLNLLIYNGRKYVTRTVIL